MNPVAHPNPFAPLLRDDVDGGRSFMAEQSRTASRSAAQSTAITLTTEEGDRVTLSLAKATQTQAGTYQSLTYGSGTAATNEAAFLRHTEGSQATIDIEGDLSEEEWAEIEQVVEVIDHMMDGFLSGDLAAMTEDAAVLKELDTITSLEAAFSLERQVMYAHEEHLAIRSEEPDRGLHGFPHLQRLMHHVDRFTNDMAGATAGFRGRRNAQSRSIEALFNQYEKRVADNAVSTDQATGSNQNTQRNLAMEVFRSVKSSFYEKVQVLSAAGDKTASQGV
jgi:hypothetical protein